MERQNKEGEGARRRTIKSTIFPLGSFCEALRVEPGGGSRSKGFPCRKLKKQGSATSELRRGRCGRGGLGIKGGMILNVEF